MAANAFIGSRLDYCNALSGSFSASLCKLQYIQNSRATIVCEATKYLHVTPIRKTMHGYPFSNAVFKKALLVYKFLKMAAQNISIHTLK